MFGGHTSLINFLMNYRLICSIYDEKKRKKMTACDNKVNFSKTKLIQSVDFFFAIFTLIIENVS